MQADILVIGDTHYLKARKKAITVAEESILSIIKDHTFKRIVLLGDLFDKKPTAEERCMLVQFLLKLRKHTKHFDFIIGNGKHTFEAESIHEQDWIDLCEDFHQHEELTLDKYVFGHYEVKGTKYINGFKSKSDKEVDAELTYILGHIHQPSCSFGNVNYLGSIYKVTYAEIQDEKRIAIINKGKLKYYPIESRPMYQITLLGKDGKVGCKESKLVKSLPEGAEIDLKIVGQCDSQTTLEFHRVIKKLKEKFTIEYYMQDITTTDLKTDIPKDLDQDTLLREYCIKKKINFDLVKKELE